MVHECNVTCVTARAPLPVLGSPSPKEAFAVTAHEAPVEWMAQVWWKPLKAPLPTSTLGTLGIPLDAQTTYDIPPYAHRTVGGGKLVIDRVVISQKLGYVLCLNRLIKQGVGVSVNGRDMILQWGGGHPSQSATIVAHEGVDGKWRVRTAIS